MVHNNESENSIADSQRLLRGDMSEEGVVFVKTKRSRWQLFRSWFGSFSLGVITALLVIGAMQQWQRAEVRKTFHFAKTDALPYVPYETITFEADALYSERPNDDTDFAWDMLLPNGRGFVFVPDAQERGLIEGEVTPYGQIYSVAMYHQLHCLARLRKMHWIFLDGVSSGELGTARMFAGREAASHVQHCFDYLRQSITCAGDMTLEWPKQDGVSSKAKVDGWGIPHTCKSKTAIDDYMAQYHYNMSLSFDAAG